MYQVGKPVLPGIAGCLLMSLFTDNITLDLNNNDKLVCLSQIKILFIMTICETLFFSSV